MDPHADHQPKRSGDVKAWVSYAGWVMSTLGEWGPVCPKVVHRRRTSVSEEEERNEERMAFHEEEQ
jgi:hypothetical protein